MKVKQKTKNKKHSTMIIKWILFIVCVFGIVESLVDHWYSIFISILILLIIFFIVVKYRDYFWKDKKGNKLSFKEFTSRFKKGVEGITPLQQVRTTLWSMIPIFAGMVWGIVMTFLSGTYWLSLILVASLPITSIQFIGQLQKFWRFKEIDKLNQEVSK